jgi:hypothetical protein
VSYLEKPNQVVLEGLTKLRASVGSLEDVDMVILVGGAAHFYKAAVMQLFEGIDVRVAMESHFANVRGFQLIAQVEASRAEAGNSAAKVKA